MIPQIVFFISYFFYVYFFYINLNKLIYPIILFPLFVYMFLFIFVYFDFILKKDKFSNLFKKYLNFLYIFLLFFISPIFIKLNIPYPHNFMQRKLEIILGATFVTFISLCTINLAVSLYKNRENVIEIKKSFWFITIFFYIFYLGVSLWFNYANQPTGDEPEYIMMAHSLLHDRDLDLNNNFENKDYKLFYKDKELCIQDGAIRRGDKIYSYHPFMISVLVAPFYLIGQRLGATFFINFVAALLIGIIFTITVKVFRDTKTSILTSFVAGFSMPVLNHINHISADITSSFILSTALYFLLFERGRYIIFSLLLMFGLWIHLRNAPVLLMLFLLFAIFNRKNVKALFISSLMQIANILLLFFVNGLIYGVIVPKQISGGESILYGFGHNIVNSFLGILFDQEFGLFFYTPIFILVPAGYYFLYKTRKQIFYTLLFIFLPFLIFICSWDWRGGGGSSPRFLLPLIYTLIIPVAAIYNTCKDKVLLYVLSVVGFFISYIILLIPWFRWNKGNGENWILKIMSTFINIDLTKIFPSIPISTEFSFFPLIFWIVVIFVLNIWVIVRGRNILTNNKLVIK